MGLRVALVAVAGALGLWWMLSRPMRVAGLVLAPSDFTQVASACGGQGGVAENEAVSIGGEAERHVQQLRERADRFLPAGRAFIDGFALGDFFDRRGRILDFLDSF